MFYSSVNQSIMQDQIRNAIDPTEIPEFPTAVPQEGGSSGTQAQE